MCKEFKIKPISFEVSQSFVELNKCTPNHFFCMMKLFLVNMQLISLWTTFLRWLIHQIIPQQISDSWKCTGWICDRNVDPQVLSSAVDHAVGDGLQFLVPLLHSHWSSKFTRVGRFGRFHIIFIKFFCYILQFWLWSCCILDGLFIF